MGSLEGVSVGDTLIMVGVNMRGRTEEVTVTKVGRKYVYAGQWANAARPYHKHNGVKADGYGHETLRTPAQHAEVVHRVELLKEIRELGLEPARLSCNLPTIVLQRVLAALKSLDS